MIKWRFCEGVTVTKMKHFPLEEHLRRAIGPGTTTQSKEAESGKSIYYSNQSAIVRVNRSNSKFDFFSYSMGIVS